MVKIVTRAALAAVFLLGLATFTQRANASPTVMTWGCTTFSTCNQSSLGFGAPIDLVFSGPASNEELGDTYDLTVDKFVGGLGGTWYFTLTDASDGSGTLHGLGTLLSIASDKMEITYIWSVNWSGFLDGVNASGMDQTTITELNGAVESAAISSVVPEPASLLLLGTGMLGVGAAVRRLRLHA